MKKRKTIAVVVGTTDGFYRNRSLIGIIRQAKRLDYNIAVFSVFTLTGERTKHQIGEENIYSLLKTSEIAGVVFVDYTFWADEVRQKMLDMFRTMPDLKLVVLDNDGIENYEGILSNDRKGFAAVVDHLIEVHGFKKVYCLTGAEIYPVSHLRLNGYKDSMRAHGLDPKDEYVFFGDFWTMAATDMAEKIASGEIERPEAIACACDKAAVTLANELVERGIDVPGEIAVTGYDLSGEAITNDPSVTTCMRPDIFMGERCICELHRMITGETVEPEDPDEGFLVCGESCGCHRDVAFAHKYNETDRHEQESASNFRFCSMQESLMAQETFDQLITMIFSRVYLLRGVSAFALCLNKDWNLFREDDSEYIKEGYQDDMFEALFYKIDNGEKRNVPFKKSELFPQDMLLEDTPVTCYFNSVHFEDRCFGYQVIRFENDEFTTPEDIYHSWASAVSVSLEYMRVQERMKLMYNRAFANSIRDGMTGLYNRQGYELYSKQVFETAREKKQKLLVIVADLDDLKKINDTYGHGEGDTAINVCARALQTCCGNGEYCVRSGGDEFIIFGTYDYDNAIPIFYRSRIDGYLARYNASAEKPYHVGMSAGFFIDFTDNYENIDECLKLADERMYANKASRKKGRN